MERRWVAIRGSRADQGTTARERRAEIVVSGHAPGHHLEGDPIGTGRRPDLRDPQAFEAALRDGGHRVTDSRRAVHAALVDADHLATEQAVAHGSGAVNLATVYRVLSLLEDLGLARSTRLATDGSASWELAHPDDHVHLVCDRCGDVDHHVGDAVSRLRGHLLDGHGFAASEVDLVVRGSCAACRGVAPPSAPGSVADGSPVGRSPVGRSRAGRSRAGRVV